LLDKRGGVKIKVGVLTNTFVPNLYPAPTTKRAFPIGLTICKIKINNGYYMNP